ncbi:MurR/RpiR family transcriptional regulator [Alkalicoccus luteus]|uniref:MurR/RpiR family transcriptional regulator n=1 Tax=Alkalicoccus luteus TaxID=1237094 RepID=A0A969TTL8_9BACI|nr:MurR/RpiR family transcriptional regulator [Alkalicoccus luteus]NJP36066.1 MurR/RpiR family transcriptional regulator [Alkalicoccus luteus]
MQQLAQGHCKHRIRASYNEFRAKEKVIADYILEHPEEIIHSTISQVADNLHVAEATVFRFCKRIGFKGYQAMKIALASELVKGVKDIHETIQEGDDEKTIAEKMFKANTRTLEDTLSVIDEGKMKQAVDILVGARRIEFYGNGGSGIVAMDAHHKFIRTGIPTAAYSDSHLQLMSASQLTPEDAVVFISHSGTNHNILEAVDIVQSAGIPTIGITTIAKSPLSERVDVALFTVSEETEYRSEALSSRLAQLSFIDALYVNVSMQKKEQVQHSTKKMREAIARTRI